MADGQVTGGMVRVMERVKTGDYEHKEIAVELHFNVLENKDYRDLFDTVADAARDQTQRLLGRTVHTIRSVDKRQTAAALTKVPVITIEHSEPEVEAKVPAVVNAASMEDVAEVPVVVPVSGAAAAVSVPAPADPTAVVDDEFTAVREITDKDLMNSITAANAKLIPIHKEKGTLMIRELIAKYVPAGRRAVELKQDQRSRFLIELDTLK